MTTAEKSARYRAKDVEGYRRRKRELTKLPEHKETHKLYMRKWRGLNRDRHNELARESYQRNKHKYTEAIKERHYKRCYGMSLDDKMSMIAMQDNKCLICNNEFTSSGNTHVDHCHKTSIVRGILCNVCNTKLGWFELYKDSVINYLDRTSKEIKCV